MKRVVIFVIQHNKMTISFSFLFFSYSTFHFFNFDIRHNYERRSQAGSPG